MEPVGFLIEHADVIATCTGPAPKRGASHGALVALGRTRLDQKAACGTTTCETKSDGHAHYADPNWTPPAR